MSWWVKVLVTKVDDLSLIRKIHTVEEWIPAGCPQISTWAMVHSTSTRQCMPNILALRRQRQEDDSKSAPVWSTIYGAPGQNQGYPVSPSFVIQYSHTQYLFHVAIIKEQNPILTPINPRATYRKYANSLWNTGKLTVASRPLPQYATAVSAGCWGRCHEDPKLCSPYTQFFPVLPSPDCSHTQWRHSSACVAQQRSKNSPCKS